MRNGPPNAGIPPSLLLDMLAFTPVERFLEAMAGALNGSRAEGVKLKVNLVLSDTGESYVLDIANAVLHHHRAPPATDANATLTLTKSMFLKLTTGTAGVKDTLMSDDLTIAGSRIDLLRFFALFDRAQGVFPIVTRD